MAWIITTDLHLTANPLDEYRWGLFPFLNGKIKALGKGVHTLFVLGDLTQDKDRHPAVLVNRVVSSFVQLYRSTGLTRIIFLRGNHDGLGDVAFFEFLRCFSFMEVITLPCTRFIDLKQVALLPHTKKPIQDWATIEFSEVDYVLMHQTAAGAVAESGRKLEGDNLKWLGGYNARIYSGDIHVPQTIGNIRYVGAPYPIRFGDDFEGRVICINGKKRLAWPFPTIRREKAVIKNIWELSSLGLREKDQLKVEFALDRSELYEWDNKRRMVERWCDKHGVVLVGTTLHSKPVLRLKTNSRIATKTPEDALKRYVNINKVEKPVVQVGTGLLQKATEGHKQRTR